MLGTPWANLKTLICALPKGSSYWLPLYQTLGTIRGTKVRPCPSAWCPMGDLPAGGSQQALPQCVHPQLYLSTSNG